MSELAQVLEAVKGLQATQESQGKTLSEVIDAQKKAKTESPWGVPFARKGESVLSSRGYSFMKALGVLGKQIEPENAKVEWGLSDQLKNYHSAFKGFKSQSGRSFFLPIGGDFLVNEPLLGEEVRQVVKAGAVSFTQEDVEAMRKDAQKLGLTRTLSWMDETLGGSLVAPPQFGELIELLRVNEVFMAAGARVIPMPPQGRITFPAQKTAMTAYHVGESQLLTDSTPGTGDLILQAKKLTILAKIPNELFHFSAIPIEAFVREDMTKVISIAMDKALFESVDADVAPKGLINYSAINTYTSIDPGTTTDGYRLQPGDAYNMIATVEEQNAQFKAFVMRPLLWSTLVTRRTSALVAGDNLGNFVFNLIRDVGDGANLDPNRLMVGTLVGKPVFRTTQLSVARAKGASTNLTYVIGGDFTDFIVALGGALEFQVSTQGDTPFTLDQTWFKGVMYYDGGPRHESSFVICDQLYQST